MNNSEHESPLITEDMRRAWAEIGRRRDETATRRKRMLAAVVLLLAGLISVFYFLAVR